MPDRHRLSMALATLVRVEGRRAGFPILTFVEVIPVRRENEAEATRHVFVYDSLVSREPPIGEVVPGDWDRLVPAIREPRVGVTYDCRLVGGAVPRIAMRPVSPAEVVAARRAGRW